MLSSVVVKKPYDSKRKLNLSKYLEIDLYPFKKLLPFEKLLLGQGRGFAKNSQFFILARI